MDQRELVERAQRGDHDAFGVLAGLFVARLDSAARLILRDHELARDAVQEGFIRAWRNLPTLRDPDRFEGWLRSLVARSCIDVLRRRGRRPIEVELSPVDGPTVSRCLRGHRRPRPARPDPPAAATRVASRRRPALLLRLAAPGRRRGARDPGRARRSPDITGRSPSCERPCPISTRTRCRSCRGAARMTTFDRFEREIPELMAELAPPRVPDYFDDMLRQAARTRQRPAWSALERWIPMGVIARTQPMRPMPWRLIAIGIALLLLAGAALLYAGSRPHLPAPFGPARNGQILFATLDGEIMTIDPSTGAAKGPDRRSDLRCRSVVLERRNEVRIRSLDRHRSEPCSSRTADGSSVRRAARARGVRSRSSTGRRMAVGS